MSGSNVGALALGIVGGVIGFFIGGPVGALYGFSLGATVGGLLFPPEMDQGGDLRPDELQFTNSTESQTIPVIFGTVRVPGNHIGYDPDSFSAVETFDSAEGGKGGGGNEQSTGFLYRLTYEVGLCMGEVDELVDVQGSPGEDSVLYRAQRIDIEGDFTITAETSTISRDTPTDPDVKDLDEILTVGQYILISDAVTSGNNGEKLIQSVGANYFTVLEGSLVNTEGPNIISIRGTTFEPAQAFDSDVITETFQGDQDLGDGGSVHIYPGTLTQTNPDGDNFRGVCFAQFRSFSLGRQSAPRSYLFTMRRFPRCRDSSGDIIATIPPRAGNDETVPEWDDANPAAVIWELFTQGFPDGVTVEAAWGKGMSPDKLNQSDFETAAVYYQNKRLGISTAIGGGSDSLRDLLSKLRDIFGLWVWWDGEQLRCRVFWDRDNAYQFRNRITKEDINGEIGFSRSSQASVANELRLQFSNRRNNFQKEAITRQDLGSIETLGVVRSESFESKEVGTRRAADLLAGRLLRALSYPVANCQFSISRNFAYLQPGDFVELVTDTWRNGKMTSFWRVLSLEDDETSANDLKLTLEEDQFATARDGEIEDFTLPIISVDVDVPLDDGDFELINYAAASAFGAITPILAAELPIWVSGGSRRLAAAIQRRNGGIQSISTGYAETPFTDYQTLGVSSGFAITGTLPNGLPETLKIVRNTREGDHFDLELMVSSDETDFLNAAGKITGSSDSFSLLTSDFSAIMVVGSEIIRIGLAEEDSPGVYTVKNAIRGEFGTKIESHATDATFWFFPTFDRAIHSIDATKLPRDVATKLRIQAFSGNGSSDAVILDGPDSGGFGGRSVQPMTPEPITSSRTVLSWTVKVRPRIHFGGANFGPNLEAEFQSRELSLGGLLFKITTSDGDTVTLPDYFESGSESDGDLTVTKALFIPSNGTNPESTGLIEFGLSFTTNPASIEIIPVLNNVSGEPLTILQPS